MEIWSSSCLDKPRHAQMSWAPRVDEGHTSTVELTLGSPTASDEALQFGFGKSPLLTLHRIRRPSCFLLDHRPPTLAAVPISSALSSFLLQDFGTRSTLYLDVSIQMASSFLSFSSNITSSEKPLPTFLSNTAPPSLLSQPDLFFS